MDLNYDVYEQGREHVYGMVKKWSKGEGKADHLSPFMIGVFVAAGKAIHDSGYIGDIAWAQYLLLDDIYGNYKPKDDGNGEL